MQKYTLSIADMQINVVTDEPRENVDRYVGILDRKMREIALKSKRCPKNEAALLCALEFCADKIKMKEELEELDDRIEAIEAELGDANKRYEQLEIENQKLRATLEGIKIGSSEATVSAPVAAETEETGAAADDTVNEAEAAEIEAPEEKPAVSKRKANRNKVGSMFDLLTFSDI